MKGKVVVADYYYDSIDIERKIVEDFGAQFLDYHCTSEEELIEKAKDADVLVVQFQKVTENVLKSLPNLKAVIRYAVGVDIIDIHAASEYRVYVANVPDYGIDEVSCHAVSMLLSCIRKLPQMSKMVKQGSWNYNDGLDTYRTSGKTLGIMGFGKIAQLVAHKLSNFGFKIIACDPNVRASAMLQVGVEKVDMDELYERSDYISVHIPLNDSTYHIIDKNAFSKMKKGVIIVNTGRGGVIDEDALLWALDEKIVASVGLDVLEKEPIDKNSALLQKDEVLITPHFAWYSKQAMDELHQMVGNEAVRVLSGNVPLNLVNKDMLIKNAIANK